MATCLAVADNSVIEVPQVEDKFKGVFKKYKRKDKPLDLSGVVDVDALGSVPNKTTVPVEPNLPSLPHVCGVKSVQEWKVYHFLKHKGFYLIRNPFLPGFQRYWVSRCLADLPRPPNVTNLRIHPDIDPDTLWSNFETQHKKDHTFDNSCPLRKLRWTTIGYHYNWDTKEYSESEHTPFPEDVGVLARYVTEVLGFCNFRAEAGIVNYYHLDSTLAGHTDHSELDHQAPLVSISFGQDAIFLLGGQTKATEPTAVLLRSGDVCVMSGPARLAYHAVPRILRPVTSAWESCFDTSLFQQEEDKVQRIGELNASKTEEVPKDSAGCHGCGESQRDCFQRDKVLGDSPKKDSNSIGRSVEKKPCLCVDPDPEPSRPVVPCESYLTDCTVNPTEINLQDNPCVGTDEIGIGPSSHSKEYAQAESGVARRLPDIISAGLVKKVNDKILETQRSLDWQPFATYLQSSRLNVNIRQVLKPGQTFQSHVPKECGALMIKKPRTENPS